MSDARGRPCRPAADHGRIDTRTATVSTDIAGLIETMKDRARPLPARSSAAQATHRPTPASPLKVQQRTALSLWLAACFGSEGLHG